LNKIGSFSFLIQLYVIFAVISVYFHFFYNLKEKMCPFPLCLSGCFVRLFAVGWRWLEFGAIIGYASTLSCVSLLFQKYSLHMVPNYLFLNNVFSVQLMFSTGQVWWTFLVKFHHVLLYLFLHDEDYGICEPLVTRTLSIVFIVNKM
jgi:hypothetical protein